MKKVVPPGAILIPDSATRVFKGVIFDTYQWPQTLFDGSKKTFEMLKRPDTVLCIGVVENKQLLVIEDGQPHVGSLLSFPGGRVDKTDASTLAAVQREMKEETGYSFSNWRLIQVLQPHKKLEWFIYVFIASEVQEVTPPHLDAGEKITVTKRTFSEVKELSFQKAGYLGEAQDLLRAVGSTAELLALPEFKGQEVDR